MKKHFKMYKASKLWLTATIVALGLWGSSNAYAAELPASSNNSATARVAVTTNQSTTKQSTDLAVANNQNQNSSINIDKTVQAVTNINGYQQVSMNGHDVWQNNQGQLANGWQQNDTNWYYFKDGQQTGNWQLIGNQWYYLNPRSKVMETGLQKINNNTYYLNSQHDDTFGAMKTSWQLVDGHWYYFTVSGAATTGWAWLNNQWFYFDPTSAQLQAGLQKINNSTYYLNTQHDGTFGTMKTGWQWVNGHWYYFAPNGAATTGWQEVNNKWYYLDPQNNQMQVGWVKPNDTWYLLKNDGAVQTGWLYYYKHWYYYNNDANIASGWQKINGRWYYFDSTTHQATSGLQQINGAWYDFDPSNAWAKTGWQKINGSWYYFDEENAWAYTGIHKINGLVYDFDQSTGKALTGNQIINGQSYHFDENNAWATDKQEELTNRYIMRPVNIYQPSEYDPYPNVSQTPNFWVHVSIRKNRVYLMSGNRNIYTMYSSAGLGNNTPTGTYYVQPERGYQFYVASQGEGAYYWTSWLGHGIYLFHSVPFDGAHHIIGWEAAKLGKAQGSHGCIRLSLPDAKWFQQNVPTGTKVVITEN